MSKHAYHPSIEGAQHGAKSLEQFLDYAHAAGAEGAQSSNYMSLDGISSHCPFWVHTTAWTGSRTIRPFIPLDIAKKSATQIATRYEDILAQCSDTALWLNDPLMDACTFKSWVGQRGKGARARVLRQSINEKTGDQLPKVKTMHDKQTGKTIRIFTIYVRHDASKMLRMREIVNIAKHEFRKNGVGIDIQFWADDELCVGDRWKPAILDELMSADIIVELLSFKFLASSFIQAVEHPLALKRASAGDASLFAVILESCPWKGAGLEPWQVAPSGRPITDYVHKSDAWNEVYEMFHKLLGKWASGPSQGTKAA